MYLITSPSHNFLRKVKQLQKRLNFDGWHPEPEKELSVLRQLSESIKKNKDLGSADDVPDFLLKSFSFSINPELKINQIIELSTDSCSLLSMYDLLKTWDEIEDHIHKASPIFGHSDTTFFLATAAHGSTNARVFIPDNSSTRIIMFYNRLFYYVDDLSWLLPIIVDSRQMRIMSEMDITQATIAKINQEIPGNTRFQLQTELLFERYFKKQSQLHRLKQPEGLAENSRVVAMDIESSILYFIICHEIAHILCNHTDMTSTKFDVTGDDNRRGFSEINRKWKDEFEADHVGFQLGLIAARGNLITTQVYIWSLATFFLVNSLIEDYRLPLEHDIIDKGTEDKTHPPLQQRWQYLRKIIENLSSESNHCFDLTVPETIKQELQKCVSTFSKATD